MQSANSIIDELGGTGQVATALSLSDSTVSSWRSRRGIPAAHWGALVRLAGERGRNDITLELLASLVAREMPQVAAEAR